MCRWIARALLIVTFALLSAGLTAAPARADGGYVGGIDDLPLMPGLVEDTQSGLVFRSPAGRIVDAYAAGRVRADRVADFYAEVLPQLGWRRIDSEYFARDGEILEIEALPEVTDANRVTVRFSLSPGTANARR